MKETQEAKQTPEQIWRQLRKMNWDNEYAENGVVNKADADKYASTITAQLVEALREIYDTLSADDKVITQYLPEGESSYRPNNWLEKTKNLLAALKSVSNK